LIEIYLRIPSSRNAFLFFFLLSEGKF